MIVFWLRDIADFIYFTGIPTQILYASRALLLCIARLISHCPFNVQSILIAGMENEAVFLVALILLHFDLNNY